MKINRTLFLILLLFSVVISSCSPGRSPSETVKGYYDALAIKDFEAAKVFVAKGFRSAVKNLASMMSEKDFQNAKQVEVISEDIFVDNATVKIKIPGSSEERTLNLISENDEWRLLIAGF